MVRDLALVFLLGFSFIFQQCNCYNGVVVSNTCNVMPREYPVGSRGGPGRGSRGRSPPDPYQGRAGLSASAELLLRYLTSKME